MTKKSVKILFSVLFSCVLLFSFATLRIAAEEIGDDEPFDDPQSSAADDEPSQYEPQTDYFPDETQAAPEPETSHQDEPDEPDEPERQTEAAAPVDNGDDDDSDDSYTPAATQSAQDEYLSLSQKAAQEYQSNNSVKMDKSVSDKTYSTDYTAGVVSWICVGVGIVVIIVMLVSTKITGKRASRRRI